MKYGIFCALLLVLYGFTTFRGIVLFSSEEERDIPTELRGGGYRVAPVFWGGGFAGGK